MRRLLAISATTFLLLTALSRAAHAAGGPELVVMPVGSWPAESFAELDRQGLTVVIVGRSALVVPGSVRGKSVAAAQLLDEIAKFHNLRVQWRADGRVAVLCPATPEQAADIDSAEAARKAGRALDVRAIPALIAAATGADADLAWHASRALQRIGWQATLALGGQAAWDWRVAAADRASYRGSRPLAQGEPDYLAFLDAAGRCGPLVGTKPLGLLAEAVDHWHRGVRSRAILAATRLAPADAARLIEKAHADPSRLVRGVAAEAAGRVGDIPRLAKLLADQAATMRYRAADGLGQAGGDKAALLLTAALADEDPLLRQRAISALAALGGEAAFARIRQVAAAAESDLALRRRAVSCLGAVGGERALDVLAALLADGEAPIRFAAASAMGFVGPKALEPLAKVVGDTDEQVAIQAMASIARIGGPKAVGLLDQALADPDEYVRAAAAKALGEVGGAIALPPLQKALADSDSLVRAAAATALGRAGAAEALPLLQGALADRDIGVRADVATAMASFGAGNDPVWSVLAKLATDEDSYVAGKAVAAASMLGGPKSVDVLRKAASHSALKIRVAAVTALGLSGGDEAILRPFLADACPELRAAALQALGEIGSAAALDEIDKALTASKADATVRQAALNAAVRVGGERALAVVEKAIGGLEMPPDPAITAIGEMGGVDGARTLPILEKALARPRKPYFHHDELEAMGRLRGADRARVLSHLERYILSPDSDRARAGAALGLAHLGGTGCADVLAKAMDVQDKITESKDTMSVRQELLTFVGTAEQTGAAEILRRMAEAGARTNRAQYVQTGQAALIALNDYSDDRDVPVMSRILAVPHSPDAPGININYTAADSLGRIGGTRARDALIEGLRNPKINSRVKASIVMALTDYYPGDGEARKAISANAAK